jgi:hypothetical protein
MKRLLALAVLGSAVLLTACDGSGNGSAATGGTTSAATLPQLMAQLFNGSTDNERSLPLDINTIDIDATSEAPTQFDTLLM